VAAVADALVAGKAVGIHDGRMEFGPRALGARSILASPARREINDSLRPARLSRSDFMPFAPVVLSEYAEQLFDIRVGNAHAARFMTITCDVRAAVGATAFRLSSTSTDRRGRKSSIPSRERSIAAFWKLGIPVAAFPRSSTPVSNVHEEPIVDSPEQALAALEADRVDLLVLNGRIFERRGFGDVDR